MDDWKKEFTFFSPPYAHNFVTAVKREKELERVNDSYDKQTVHSSELCRRRKVTFDNVIVILYFKPRA